MKTIRLLSIAAIAATYVISAATSSATVSFKLWAERFNDASGNPIPVNSLMLLIADTTQDAATADFSELTSGVVAQGNLLNGKYKIIDCLDLSAYATPGVLYTSTPELTLDSAVSDTTPGSWSPGDPLAIVWFPTLTFSLGMTIPQGTPYGILTAGTDGSDPFITPADGTGGHTLSYYSSEATNLSDGGSGAPTSANHTSVPEPSTAVSLIGLGFGAYLLARRSQKRAGAKA